MVCCAIVALIIASLIYPFKKMFCQTYNPKSPLEWRLNDNEQKTPAPFSLKARGQSVGYALKGISSVVRNEHNAWIHITAALLVIFLGIHFQISRQDWNIIVIAITFVFFAETINTAFEYLCDVVSPEKNKDVAFAKDITAGAVLICAIGAAIIGVITFYPYLMGGNSKDIYDLTSSICRFSF